MGRRYYVAGLAGLLLAAGSAGAGQNVTIDRHAFDLPPQQLKYALRAVTRQFGLQLFADAHDLQGRTSPQLRATLDPQEAFDELLGGTGLAAHIEGKAVFIRGRAQAASEQPVTAPSGTAEIVVTGTRIRGSEAAAKVATFRRDDIGFAGQSDLGSFVRTLPSNYNGGQNPGIVGGGDQGGQDDINGASELNLRGLGPDATLTLIDGHRIAYDAQSQGIDIAAIPLDAIDRIEVVADGSSALYGSDAVGGVANVLLRRDYSGLDTSARIGGATDGGDLTRQFDLVSGDRWTSGGFMIAGDYDRNGAIRADLRSFTRSLDPSATLLPAQRQYSAVLSGHQSLSSRIAFAIDAQFSDRTISASNPAFVDADVRTDGLLSHSHVRSFSLAPSLTIEAGHDWRITLQGVYGSSDTHVASTDYSGGAEFDRAVVRYDNRLATAEANAEGPLATLPAGPIRLALGGGYRRFSLAGSGVTTYPDYPSSQDSFDKSRTVLFGYGEILVPIYGPANAAPWMQDLHLTGALRYEDYRHVGRVATPKLGIVARPIPAVTLKASWGRSFKAPTLYEENEIRNGALLPGFIFAPNTPPAGSSILLIGGGNPGLKPERATTWSSTLTLKPGFVPRLTIEASYYHIDYKSRVVAPITSVVGALANIDVGAFVQTSPSAEQFAAALDTLTVFNNETGAAIDPASVAAIIDDSLRNAARQKIQGVDLETDYRVDLGSRQSLSLNASATYLQSDQQLSAAQPDRALAGTIFHPPHWRARAGGVLSVPDWRFGSFVTYIGGVVDNRATPSRDVGGFHSIDLSVQYAPSQGPLAKLSATLNVENLFDERPGAIADSNPADPPYDTTNYPAIGRFVALTIARHW